MSIKFNKTYIILLLALIVIGLVAFFLLDAPSEEQPQQREEIAEQTPPGYETMVSVAQITNTHLLENAILNIQVTPKDAQEDVSLQLQTTEFVTEDTLLKNTYNLLQDIRQIETLATFTIAWFAVINGENTDVLTMTFDDEALQQFTTISYNELRNIATSYVKSDSLN